MLFEKGQDRRNRPKTISHRLRGPYLAGQTAPGPEDAQPEHETARTASDHPTNRSPLLDACCFGNRHGTGSLGRCHATNAARELTTHDTS
jgi:hypothetical protein